MMQWSSFSSEKSQPFIALQLGVWRVLLRQDPPFHDFVEDWRGSLSESHHLCRFIKEIYHLGPALFILIVLAKVWSGIESALLLYLSSQVLMIIEAGVTKNKLDVTAILYAILSRVVCIVTVAFINWWIEHCRPMLKNRVMFHFEEKLIQANLKTDILTPQDAAFRDQTTSRQAWDSFEQLLTLSSIFVSTASQLALIFRTSRLNNGGPIFGLLCVAKPLLGSGFRKTLWGKPHVVFANNASYLRMLALQRLSEGQHRQEVIGGNLSDYIISEYKKARVVLGDTSEEYAASQYELRSSPLIDMAFSLLSDLPMVYCATNAILNPSRFSLTSIAILQQSAWALSWTLERVFDDVSNCRRHLQQIRDLLEATSPQSALCEGKVPYPGVEEKRSKGMAFELRNLSFVYPEKLSTAKALKGINLTIKSGQLVVIVGANGSGKSTIIKILTRLYEPTSGELLVDGLPIQSYRVSDLRQATAPLIQDHSLFPLSVYENIGLGLPERCNDYNLVWQAARLGGAQGVISRFSAGLDTIINPVNTVYAMNTSIDNGWNSPELDDIHNPADVSGGERQRLVAARTFMRLFSDRIRFVVADEPSSALDPQGEYELFQNLQAQREGKTMVFVTHRFGHLTKHADLIVCMKEGAIVESGTHKELIALKGEYTKLYDIQASPYKCMP